VVSRRGAGDAAVPRRQGLEKRYGQIESQEANAIVMRFLKDDDG
jgi:hypothetical protein